METFHFDDENKSNIPPEDLSMLRDYIQENILRKNNQQFLKYSDWMTIKSLIDILKFEDDQ